MTKFIPLHRDQPFLLPPDLRDWVLEDDLAHFVVEAVERVPMGSFVMNEPVFGIVKQVLGFRRFHLRGLTKIDREWKLLMLACNCKRLHNLMAA